MVRWGKQKRGEADECCLPSNCSGAFDVLRRDRHRVAVLENPIAGGGLTVELDDVSPLRIVTLGLPVKQLAERGPLGDTPTSRITGTGTLDEGDLDIRRSLDVARSDRDMVVRPENLRGRGTLNAIDADDVIANVEMTTETLINELLESGTRTDVVPIGETGAVRSDESDAVATIAVDRTITTDGTAEALAVTRVTRLVGSGDHGDTIAIRETIVTGSGATVESKPEVLRITRRPDLAEETGHGGAVGDLARGSESGAVVVDESDSGHYVTLFYSLMMLSKKPLNVSSCVTKRICLPVAPASSFNFSKSLCRCMMLSLSR